MPARSRLLRLVVGALLLAPAAAPVMAVDDVTAPTGSVAVVHDDRPNELVRLSVPATDDASGVAFVEVSGDGTTWAAYPYAPEIDWPAFDPAVGGDPAYGTRTVHVRWTDGVGNTSEAAATTLYLSRNGALEYPRPPVTGQLFTIRPIYGPGAAPTSGECSWELRWGDDRALRDNKPNETFGTMFLSGKPDRGFCGPWTFTLPWVPVRQFEVYFGSWVMSTEDDVWDQRAKFYPTVGSTDRRIRQSNLPMVQVLPDKYELVVGQQVTYRAYPLGVTLRSDDTWIAYCPDFSCNGGGIAYKIKYGGSTFSFSPPFAGTWFVVWNGVSQPYGLNAGYDPKVRKPDYYRPNTTPPVQKVASASPDGRVPVSLSWSGSDKGWGIARYRLQRRIDGGSWQTVTLPTPKTTSIVQLLATGHQYQFRVRAIDEYGNRGYWDYGPTFKPKLIGDGHAAITYRRAWTVALEPAALGGSLHQSDVAGASARLQFIGRDVAWVAQKGPGLGRARVYVDGDLRATIDLGAASEGPPRVVFRRHWSASGSHTIRVVVEGTASRPTVTLDGFVILR